MIGWENGWRTRVTYGAAALWTFALVLWPVPSNLRSGRDGERLTASAGEGLYKSDLTQANFGLLGVRFFESNEGQPSWNIRAEFAELHRQKENYAFMKTVNADFFSGASRNVVRTQSDYGRSHFNKRLVELEGNVIVQSEKGYRFMMDRLDYDSGGRKFHSDDVVNMSGPDVAAPEMFLTGTGLDADLNDDSFVVRKNTRARRRLSTKEWMRIQSRGSIFHPDSQQAVFIDRVRAVLPNMSIESDRMEMNVSGEGGEILKATGNVVLYHKKRKGRSEIADIEIANDKVILQGNRQPATIVGEDSELKGRRITLYTDEDRVEVQEAEGSMEK